MLQVNRNGAFSSIVENCNRQHFFRDWKGTEFRAHERHNRVLAYNAKTLTTSKKGF